MTAFPFVFSNPVDSDAAMLPLDGLGLIAASGPEARGFLQSQLSNDAKLISASQGQLSGYCSPKGRLLAVFTVIQLADDDFALILPAALTTSTLKRLKMFVLRSKLVLRDASSELPALGLIGERASAALDRLGFSVPATDYGTARHEGCWLLRRPGPVPRFELRGSSERLSALKAALPLPTATATDWALAELLAGIPQVTAETVEHFVPQTIDLDRAGGVSFTKGCYPGQEIVARVHYLGRVKQRLHLAGCDSHAPPGAPVFTSEPGSQAIGELMATAPLATGGYGLSFALQLDQAGRSDLRLGATDGPAIGRPQRVHPET